MNPVSFTGWAKSRAVIGLAALILGASLITNKCSCQDTTGARSFYIGGTFGVSGYTTAQREVPVSPAHGSSAEVGLDVFFPWANGGFLKLGLEYSYYRSAFENDTSYYDEWLQLPVIIRIADLAHFSTNSRLVLSAGPRFSLLARQGRAGQADVNYDMDEDSFGGVYKTGIVSELAVYRGPRNGHIQSFGIRAGVDLSGWSAILGSDRVVVNDHYVIATLFYNINFR